MQAKAPAMPLFSAGFRPFFLAAASWSVIALLVWICVLLDGISLPSRFDPLTWHIHEMLFGFIMAGIGGFLLTAIPNWTGRAPVSGAPLILLVGFWALGRGACLISADLPIWLGIAADLAFPVALEVVATRELLAVGNRRNYPLLVPLLVLGAANLLMHLQANDVPVPDGLGWRLGIGCVMVLIAVIGGRLIPAFTRNWLRAHGGGEVAESNRLDTAALAASAVSLLVWAGAPTATLTGVLLLAAGVVHLLRLARWRGPVIARESLLLVLHLGYLWMAVALGLLGLSVLTDAIPRAAAIHAMTAGAAGTMMLAVMTRATLGHTGRTLHADVPTLAIYALVGVAALLRMVAAFSLLPGTLLLDASATAWIGAFGLFILRYGPMLIGRRA
jgi:uncharacterized protein involved in response to NO